MECVATAAAAAVTRTTTTFKVSSVPYTYFIIEHGLVLQVEIFQSVVHQLMRICSHWDQIKTVTSDWTKLKLFDQIYGIQSCIDNNVLTSMSYVKISWVNLIYCWGNNDNIWITTVWKRKLFFFWKTWIVLKNILEHAFCKSDIQLVDYHLAEVLILSQNKVIFLYMTASSDPWNIWYHFVFIV